jgi:hypothetical protein
MTFPTAPESRAELLARARQEARATMGRAAFVRRRLLPLGVPLAALAAAAALTGALAQDRPIWRRYSRRARREDGLRAAGLALLAAGGALGATWAAAHGEWALHERARRTARGFP